MNNIGPKIEPWGDPKNNFKPFAKGTSYSNSLPTMF